MIAHRGFSSRAPENTLAAFRLGWEAGADGVECDVHLTKDGQVVCIHDDHTERVGDRRLIVAETSWPELRSLDVGAWKGEEWADEKIPLLREAIATGPPSLLWVVEVKCGPEAVEPLLNAIDSTGHDWGRVVIISFNEDSLVALKAKRPDARAYWLSYLEERSDGSVSPSPAEIVDMVTALNLDGFGGESGGGVTSALAATLQSAGLDLNVWTVDDPSEARRMKSLGVTSITTNDPKRVRRALKESY